MVRLTVSNQSWSHTIDIHPRGAHFLSMFLILTRSQRRRPEINSTQSSLHPRFWYMCVCVLSFGKLARALWVVSSARENGRSSIRLPPIMGIFVDFLFGNGRATRNNHAGSREMSAKHWLNRISSTFLVVVQRKVARRSGFICANMLHKGVSLEVICTNSELVNNVSDLIF